MASQSPDAAEKGRLIAAHTIANDAEARKRVEEIYGVAVCAKMYPEAYQQPKARSLVVRILDGVRRKIPW